MVGGRRGAQRGHGIINAVLRQRDDIHIAFDHQQTLRFGVILLRFIQAVQLAAFMENIGLRGVQVFWQRIAQHAPAKTNHPASLIADREHHPFAEAVVTAPLIVGDQHARINKRLAVFLIAAKTF